VRIHGHAVGRGKKRHREFKMASGEMSEEAFTGFLAAFIRQAVAFSENGSIHYLFIDWRHLPELLAAARPLYADWKNLLVWNKTNAGQGSFYRQKHELIAVFPNYISIFLWGVLYDPAFGGVARHLATDQCFSRPSHISYRV
jgi:hypothetical protein